MVQHVRIKDIAEYTGVSIGTVDRVIHNRGNVSTEVRQRIEQAMEELGYRPNIAARTLALKQNLRIAAILPDYNLDPYWAQPKEGVDRAALATAHFGVKVEFFFFSQSDADTFKVTAEKAFSTAPDAAIIAPIFEKEASLLLDDSRWSNIPKILINTDIRNANAVSYIGQDSYESGLLAGRLLDFGLDYGDHTMLLNFDYAVGNARHLMQKQAGFEDYFKQIPEKGITVHTRTFEQFDKKSALREFLQAEIDNLPRLRGFFVTNSRAYYLVEALLPVSIKRFKVVGFDLIQPNLKYLSEGYISFLLNQNAWQQGYQGVLAIVRHLIQKRTLVAQQFLPLDIVMKENAAYYTNRHLEMLPDVI